MTLRKLRHITRVPRHARGAEGGRHGAPDVLPLDVVRDGAGLCQVPLAAHDLPVAHRVVAHDGQDAEYRLLCGANRVAACTTTVHPLICTLCRAGRRGARLPAACSERGSSQQGQRGVEAPRQCSLLPVPGYMRGASADSCIAARCLSMSKTGSHRSLRPQ